ncbi:MAG: putative toxin-antitoxin system toxin component, PIN family [Pyrinomonadaceae bacterium]
MITSVFDTNIYLQAILSEDGPARACVQLALDGAIELFITDEIIDEVRRVVTRQKLVAKYRSLQGDRPQLLISAILKKSTMASTPYQEFVFERDPSDEVFIREL